MVRCQGRTSIKGKHSKQKMFKRVQYTYQFKHVVVQHYVGGGSVSDTIATYFSQQAPARRDDIRKLINKWKKNVDRIALMASNGATASQSRMRSVGLGTVLTRDVEEEIVGWVNDLRSDGVPISATMLQLKAAEAADASGIPSGQFVASNPWKQSFLRRHRLSFRAGNRSSQAHPDDDNALGLAFAADVRLWMETHGVNLL
jgi:hypothetical protein